MKTLRRPDKILLILSLTLVSFGFLFFFSAALGDLWSERFFLSVVLKQLIALLLGLAVMFFLAYFKKINYRDIKSYTPWLFIATLILQILVFVPGLGIEFGGARRWLSLGPATIQPSEFLKIGSMLFLAALLASYGKKLQNFSNFISVCCFSLALPVLLLIIARDMGTMLVMSGAAFCMLFASRVQKIHLFFVSLLGSIGMVAFIYLFQNYAWLRIASFFGKTNDSLGADFQISQSLMTIGSGQIFGQGLGKSVQKFSYLPEPLGDSIFAVTAEEWGFFGSVIIVSLFLAFALRALYLAKKCRDEFGRLVVIGLTMLIIIQSFFNIAAMLKLVPLSGMPLIFISKGGSALLVSLVSVGIILHISRFIPKR